MSEYKYYIKKIYQPVADQVVLEIGDKRGRPVFNYRPGQYVMISYQNIRGQIEDKHAFSLASSPTEKEAISFGIRIEGPFTRGLAGLKVGDEINVFGPYGKFYFDEKKYSDLVMIAGGIGITPFFSAMNYANDLKLNNKLSLIYSARTKASATFSEEIKALEKNNPNISTLFSYTDEAGSALEINTIYKRIDAQAIKDFVGNVYGKTYFICGPSLFMAAMVANLMSLGVSRDQIEMEEFSMIPDKNFLPRLRNISYAMAFSVVIFVIFFSLILRSAASAAVKKTYDPTTLARLNQPAYDQMVATYNAKIKAITDLNQQILAATGKAGTKAVTTTSQKSTQTTSGFSVTPPSSPNTPSQPVVSTPVYTPVTQPVQTPVYTPAPVQTPTPVYTPAPVYVAPTPVAAPAPVTSASPVR